jgi:hypothetical protein
LTSLLLQSRLINEFKHGPFSCLIKKLIALCYPCRIKSCVTEGVK